LPELREILQTRGPDHRVSRKNVTELLVRFGIASDRAEIARLAIEHLERSAAEGFEEARYLRIRDWLSYKKAVGPVAPDEVEAAENGLSDVARLALTWLPYVIPTAEESEDLLGPLVAPRRSIAGYTDEPMVDTEWPPAKFFGLPDWRENPSWPVGGDGQLLMFYGQLPIDETRTAYLFTAGPDEAQPLGSGSAIVIQPGGECHLPVVDRNDGPRNFTSVHDLSRFRPRTRRLPHQERYVIWANGADPLEYPLEATLGHERWDKVGGTPVWLQGDDTPGPEWDYAFQFDAARAGSDRGDNAIFYGWVNGAGQGALGWQCS
jgi:hypothetical protein